MSADDLPLIIVRSEPGAATTLRSALAMGLDAHACPVFAIRSIAWQAPPPAAFDALLLTSANAVRHGGDAVSRYRGLPVYAVGAATSAAARDAGMAIACTGRRGVGAIVERMVADGVAAPLWLCGRDRTVVRHDALRPVAVPVYAADPIAPSAAFDRLTRGPAVALIHSARAASRFAALVAARSAIAIVAISPRAARACGPGWAAVAVASRPSDDAMLELAQAMCQKSARAGHRTMTR